MTDGSETETMPRVTGPASDRPLIGLALGAGVARGWAHIGVMRALERNHIIPDIVSGCSSGALVAGAYLSGHLDDLEEWARSLSTIKMFGFLDFKVRSSGLIGGGRLYEELQNSLGNARIEDLDRPLICVATDMTTGHEVWLRQGVLTEAIRASYALPGVFPPAEWNGRWLVDGALVNPCPVSPLPAFGARMTIAVNLNADVLGRIVPPGDAVPRVSGLDVLNATEEENISSFKDSTLARRLFRREPNKPSLSGVMVAALGIMQDRLSRSRMAGDPPDVVIGPRIGHIGPMEFDRADELIAEGEAAVEKSLPDILEALAYLNIKTTAEPGRASTKTDTDTDTETVAQEITD